MSASLATSRRDCRSGFETLSVSDVSPLSQASEEEAIIVGTPIKQQQTGKARQDIDTFASHLQGWGFDSRLHRVCGVCMFSPCLGGFLQ
ncbi:hypothetical protein QTP86_030631, partial [Hemibagrus guttatus]